MPAVVRHIAVKRIYEPAEPADGCRVLVDRLWPRGLTRADAAVDRWAKEVAPSTALRRWFAHDPAKWPHFRERYRLELQAHLPQLCAMLHACGGRPVTLLYAARDEQHNQAVVLKELLESL